MSGGSVGIVGNTLTGNGTTRSTSYYHPCYSGAGVCVWVGSMTLDNNIIFGNGYGVYVPQSYQDGGSLVTVALTANCLFGNPGGNARGISNPIGVNGIFSPCLDTGDDTKVLGALDRAGLPRLVGADRDMGAFERQTEGLTVADASLALRLAGGLARLSSPASVARLNVVDNGASQDRVDVADAIEIARQAQP